MQSRHLDVTAYTTFDHLDARAEGDGWTERAVAVLDVTSPEESGEVRLGFELDPGDLETLSHHADYVELSPDEARTLAAELKDVARAAEAGERVSSRRG